MSNLTISTPMNSSESVSQDWIVVEKIREPDLSSGGRISEKKSASMRDSDTFSVNSDDCSQVDDLLEGINVEPDVHVHRVAKSEHFSHQIKRLLGLNFLVHISLRTQTDGLLKLLIEAAQSTDFFTSPKLKDS